MNYNLESFCPEPWSQLEIDAEGDFKLCCLANYADDNGLAMDEDDSVMNIMTHSFDQAMNSETHKQHRIALSKNIKVPRCRNCYISEEATFGKIDSFPEGQSKRQGTILKTAKMIPEYATVDTVESITNLDGSISNPKIVNLDLRFGNLCNQKCIMCSPQFSSLWYEDWTVINQITDEKPIAVEKGRYKKYIIEQDRREKLHMPEMVNWWESSIWWDKFETIAADLRFIYLTGGEPLLVPALQECLDRLIRRDLAKNIIIKFDTNCSVINPKVIEKLKQFKDVLFCVSVDEVGQDRYHIIRNPGDYNRLIENMKFLISNNFRIFWISSCIGMATPYAVIRVLGLAEELKVDTFFRFLEGPKWLDIRNYPSAAKKEIIDTLRPYTRKPSWDRWVGAEINLLEKFIDYESQHRIQKFVDNMNILDTRRNIDWKKSLPDVYNLIKKHCDKVKI